MDFDPENVGTHWYDCFFWRESIFCFSFNKLFTFLTSQNSIHLLHDRQWVGKVACLELLFGRATGCCYNVHSLQDGTDQALFLSCLKLQKAGQFPSARRITHPISLAPSWSGMQVLAIIITLVQSEQWPIAHGALACQYCTARFVFLTCGVQRSLPTSSSWKELRSSLFRVWQPWQRACYTCIRGWNKSSLVWYWGGRQRLW